MHLVGSECFCRTNRILQLLSEAERLTWFRLGPLTMTDDLPSRIVQVARELRDAGRVECHDALRPLIRTHWLSSHPATQQRLDAARAENVSGVLRLDRPAAELFRDFETICRAVTRRTRSDLSGDDD